MRCAVTGARRARCAWAGVVMGVCGIVAGCERGAIHHEARLDSLHRAGDYDAAAAILFAEQTERDYGGKDWLLLRLERAAVALAIGDALRAIDALEEAESISAFNYRDTPGEMFTKWTLNDRDAPYRAQPYEDIYVSVLATLAYLASGQVEGRATVAARRTLDKTQYLREAHRRYLSQIIDRDTGQFIRSSLASRPSGAGDGAYVDSPLGAFLSTILYMHAGDRENQRVAGAYLLDAIETQRGLIGRVDVDHFRDLPVRERPSRPVLIVAFSGRGPSKRAAQVPVQGGAASFSIPFPQLVTTPSAVLEAHVEIEGHGKVALDLVEDMSLVAAENYRRAEPLIYARTLARIGLKAGLVAGAAYGVRQSTDSRDWRDVTILAGALLIWATERADLRSWVFLPGQARVALLDLPPGEHRVRVVYHGRTSPIHTSPWRTVNPAPGELTTILTHTPR